MLWRDLRGGVARQPGGDGGWGDEIAIGQPLHQGTGTKPVRAVFGIVGFSQHEQAGDRTHQVIVHPQPAHRVVGGGVNPHRLAVRVIATDPLVHRHQVAVAGGDGAFAFRFDRIGEIQIDRAAARADAPPRVAQFPSAPRGHIARCHVPVGGIHPLEEVIALLLRNRIGLSGIPCLLRQPDPAIVAQTFAHQSELALEGVAAGDAGGVDLGEAGIG